MLLEVARMKKLTVRSLINLAFGAGVAIAGISYLTRVVARGLTVGLDEHTDLPTSTYDEALERLAALRAEDNDLVNTVCRTQLLTHGYKAERVIVLIHGITNCPQQFVEFAPLLYQQGYNVLIPRMPHNGLSDRMTDELRKLTARELRDASGTYVDIARGLGEHVTVLGLSAGGTMAAWIAQHRADVDQIVMIAPMFGIGQIGPHLTVLCMSLFLALPNIPTQHFFPFQDGPTHSYLGFSTRALVEVMRLAASVYISARKRPAAVQSLLLVTNASDTAVNNNVTWGMLSRWKLRGMQHVEVYEFGREHQLIHDVIDPEQCEQQVSLVYPVLMDLLKIC